ncbi:MAG TPA: YdeI/OmpD-associated family protein [Bacteroidia bacterium]
MPDFVVNKKYLLHKYPGKGGWIYTVIEEIKPDKRAKFGWVQVSGTIDSFELKQYKLMPMSDGRLFLPVRAEIRKKIGKSEGDTVHVQLYIDNTPIEAPEEFLLCLDDEKEARKFFDKLSDSEKRFYIDWIYSAKKEETKVNRMAESINRLKKGLKRFDPAG